MISPHIFRQYDLRGIFNRDFSADDAREIGAGFATFLRQKNPDQNLKIAVGRDGRTHSEIVQKNFVAGVISAGVDVCEIGPAPTPLLNFAVCAGEFDGGAQITASHNPPDYNGFKLSGKNSHAICGEEIQEIRQIISAGKFDRGSGKISQKSFTEKWFEKLAQFAPTKFSGKIAIDAGNGIAGPFAEKFFSKFSNVVPLFCEIDGTFPNHQPDPERAENLRDLQNAISNQNCRVGLAFDGDGDRLGVVDESGKIWSADFLLLLFACDFLKRNSGGGVVFNLTATKILPAEIEKRGGVPHESKTGHSFIEQKMRATNSLLGGETSGHFFFGENYFGFDDAFLAAVKVLQILEKSGKSLAQHFTNLPATFASEEIKIPVPEENKFSVLKKIVATAEEKYPGKTLTLDGVKIFFESGWAVVRASNTSPFLTARFEADDEINFAKIEKSLREIFREVGKEF